MTVKEHRQRLVARLREVSAVILPRLKAAGLDDIAEGLEHEYVILWKILENKTVNLKADWFSYYNGWLHGYVNAAGVLEGRR